MLADETRDEVRTALDLLREDERTVIAYRVCARAVEDRVPGGPRDPDRRRRNRGLHRGLNRLR